MKKNLVRNVVVHIADDADLSVLAGRVNKLYAEIIERRLGESNLTREDKICVIERIIRELKNTEHDGIIG